VRWLERRRIETRTVKAMERGLAAMEAGRTEAAAAGARNAIAPLGGAPRVDVPLGMIARSEALAYRLGLSTEEVLSRALAIGADGKGP
jgi:hypothetical protein